MLPLIKYGGVQLSEPNLLVSNKTGTGLIKSPHPIRAIAENYPYDYALTARGFLSSIRVGVICPKTESKNLRRYLQQVEGKHSPSQKERDYLVDYPGFQAATVCRSRFRSQVMRVGLNVPNLQPMILKPLL